MKNTNSSDQFVFRLKKGTENIFSRRRAIVTALTVVAAFLLPRSTVYGNASPFAIGLAAAAGGPVSAAVFISVFIGYLLSEGVSILRYTAALVTVIGIRWSVSGFPKIYRSPYYAPTVTFISMLISGSTLLLTDKKSLTELLLIFSECLLAAGFSYFCRLYFEEAFSNEKKNMGNTKLGILCVCCVCAMSLFSIEWQSISLGRIVAAFGVLVCSVYGGIRGGCIGGCVLGLVAFLSNPSQLYLIPIYTFGGLLGGLFSKRHRFIAPLALITVNILVFSVVRTEIDYSFVVGLYEIAAATAFLPLLPPSVGRHIRMLFSESNDATSSKNAREAVASKMKKAAQSMAQVAGTVDAVSRRLSSCSEPSVGSIYKRVTDFTCDKCRKKVDCWDCHFSEIMDSFNHLTPILSQNSRIEPRDLVGFLKDRCHYQSTICTELNNAYKEYLIREDAFCRLHELRGVINDQFDTIANILTEFSDKFELPEWNDQETAKAVEAALFKNRYEPCEVCCRIVRDGHMEIALSFPAICSSGEITNICHIVEKTSGRTLSNPSIRYGSDTTDLFLAEGQLYRAIIGTSQIRCKGEKLCGDAVEIFRDDNGDQFVVLSDGMGSGGRAAVDGALTAGITAQLLKAGFGYESVLHIVNTALMTRENDETLATLDIACINLFTGELELLKAGAGPSLLLSNGRVSQIDDSSLPLGILRELTFARTRDRLVAGDVLLLMSDGISNDGLRWVEELLRGFDTEEGNLHSLSNTIVETAQKLCGNGRGDDMTVVAVKLEKLTESDSLG